MKYPSHRSVQAEGHLRLLTQRQPTKRRDKSESEEYRVAASGFQRVPCSPLDG